MSLSPRAPEGQALFGITGNFFFHGAKIYSHIKWGKMNLSYGYCGVDEVTALMCSRVFT